MTTHKKVDIHDHKMKQMQQDKEFTHKRPEPHRMTKHSETVAEVRRKTRSDIAMHQMCDS